MFKTYRATLHSPMFFASREGRVTETSKFISSTALSHALGYKYGGLEKPYILLGEEATTPSYDHLKQLPFIVSEAEPVDVSITERTFRSTTYTAERSITTTDEEVANLLGNTKGVPEKAGKSMAGWHKVREYVGASPGSEYQFTVIDPDDNLPDKLRFRIGINRTGEITASRTQKADSLALNKFILENVYNLDNNQLMDIMSHSDSYQKGTDPRLHRFNGVDTEYIETELLPKLTEEA